jgi:hypothetical protein
MGTRHLFWILTVPSFAVYLVSIWINGMIDNQLTKLFSSVPPTPWNQVGGNTLLRVRGQEEPIRMGGEKAWYTLYTLWPGPITIMPERLSIKVS